MATLRKIWATFSTTGHTVIDVGRKWISSKVVIAWEHPFSYLVCLFKFSRVRSFVRGHRAEQMVGVVKWLGFDSVWVSSSCSKLLFSDRSLVKRLKPILPIYFGEISVNWRYFNSNDDRIVVGECFKSFLEEIPLNWTNKNRLDILIAISNFKGYFCMKVRDSSADQSAHTILQPRV